VPLATDDRTALEACIEGWSTGLQLAALALHGRDPAHLREAIAALAGTHRYILDYMADEVFDRQPGDVQRLLVRTSVLDRLSGALCEALVGEDGHARPAGDGQAMLDRLEAAKLFLVPLDDSHTWYRYHHLFAGFWRTRPPAEPRRPRREQIVPV
jgi:LuxR family maltose regulon positive regulatory protein